MKNNKIIPVIVFIVLAILVAFILKDITVSLSDKSKVVKKIQVTKSIRVIKPKVNLLTSTPLGGDIYICDSKNNRIIEVNPAKQIIWQMDGIQDPDDVQVYSKNLLIVNQENYSRVIGINPQTKKIVWSYGYLGVPGSAPGYLGKYLDDSFKLPNGNILITDAGNMRAIEVNPSGSIVWQYGVTGVVGTSLGYLAAPDDAMPQTNGSILVTEVANHTAIDINPINKAINWTIDIPEVYPSDVVTLPGGDILSTDWVTPGKIQVINPSGQVVWSYQPTGVNALNHPSSAQLLPNGNYLIVDDRNNRVLVVNPKTQQIVWQYGQTGVAGIGADLLNDPSGVALATPMISPAFVK